MLQNSRARELAGSALKGLAWFHRWVGVCLCLMFATWFATGAVMVFVAFPSLSEPARTAHSESLDTARIRLEPQRAAALLGDARGLHLVSRAGEPVYVGKRSGHWEALSAQTAEPLAPIGAQQAISIASQFGSAPAVSVSGPFDYDQWVVHQQFDPWRPFYRVRLSDPARTELYVSARTGEVRQETNETQRVANWVGSVVHWIYFVPLRRSFAAWDWTVWTLSLVGLSTVIAGVWLGVTRTSKKMRSKRPAVSPFRGLLRWHHVIGLVASAFVVCWIISGWLSMDHGRLFSQGETPQAALARYEAGPSGVVAPALSIADVQQLGRVSSVGFSQVDGCNVAAARGPASSQSLLVCPSGRLSGASLPSRLILEAVHAAWPADTVISIAPVREDSPYAKAESLDSGVLQIRLRGGQPLRVFVDPVSGEIQVLMDSSRQAYAWVYYMLHTYNFPGLSDRPALRITILLIPLAVGFTFSITGVLVGIRRLRGLRPATRPSRS